MDEDKNTSFFHAITHIRTHANHISQFVDTHGTLWCDQASIEQAFLTFYKDV